MSKSAESAVLDNLLIRTYDAADQPHVVRLYTEGLLAGQPQPNDTGADIEHIGEAYLKNKRAHFWIAEYGGRVVGMIGVAEDEPDVAEIRRLRVDPELQGQGIENKLLETVLAFCRHHGYLKVVLDTRMEHGPAFALFNRFAFQHNRTKTVHGKELLEFYLDLYREPKSKEDQEKDRRSHGKPS